MTMRKVVIVLGVLFLVSFQGPIFAMSPKTQRCASMAALAHKIIESKGNRTEKESYELIRKFDLAPAHVNFLDGFVALVYSVGLRASPEEVSLKLYIACAMRS